MAQAKPILTLNEIWARDALSANKAKPTNTKIQSGWVYGEKPPHNEFNWWWNLVGQMLLHLQQHGVAAWDGTTVYQQGALVWYNNESWKSKLTNNTNHVPSEGTYWTKLLVFTDLPNITDFPNLSELQGKQLLYVVSWDIPNSSLHLNQVTVNLDT